MPSFPCRLLPPSSADGPTNMAVDHWLLDSVLHDPSSAAFRFYTWTQPTLSLGYFQPISLVQHDPRWSALPLVRRPTGGGALLHHVEITYALALPASHPLARRSHDAYRAVHSAIADQLLQSLVDARPRGPQGARNTPDRPFLCFLDRDANDLVVADGPKIVGSAQRRRSGALLQHGSLLLGTSPHAPELTGLADLPSSPPDVSTLPWADLLTPRILHALSLSPVLATFDDASHQRIAEIASTVYLAPEWTHRR